MAVREAPGATRPPGFEGIASRALILDDILTGFGQGGSVPPVAVAPVGRTRRARRAQSLQSQGGAGALVAAVGRGLGEGLRSARRPGADARRRDRPAGLRSVVWDGTADDGRTLASGVYFCEVRAVGQIWIEKLSLVR